MWLISYEFRTWNLSTGYRGDIVKTVELIPMHPAVFIANAKLFYEQKRAQFTQTKKNWIVPEFISLLCAVEANDDEYELNQIQKDTLSSPYLLSMEMGKLD